MCKPGLEIPSSCLLRHRAEPAALHGSKPKSCEQNVLPPWATPRALPSAGLGALCKCAGGPHRVKQNVQRPCFGHIK